MRIGTNCVIHSNVVIYDNTVIGNNVTIHAGTILGADGFYYKNRPKSFDKLLSGGNVVIQDDVDLGALCTIDKGVTASTTIGQGSKLDNQVHVGHDTVIGKRCLIAAQVCIAGCVSCWSFRVFWPLVLALSQPMWSLQQSRVAFPQIKGWLQVSAHPVRRAVSS